MLLTTIILIVAVALLLYAGYELAPQFRERHQSRPAPPEPERETSPAHVAFTPVSPAPVPHSTPAWVSPPAPTETPQVGPDAPLGRRIAAWLSALPAAEEIEDSGSMESRPATGPAGWVAAVFPTARARREAGILAGVNLLTALLYYLPFILRLPTIGGIPFQGQTLDRVYGMWDGPIFITEAATLWDPNPNNPIYAWQGQPPLYYTAHYPLFPLAVRLVSYIFGYWIGGLVVNVLVTTAVTLMLYLFLRRFSCVPSAAFWIALLAIFWPPRQFFYRYVLMSEPLFVLGVLGAAYFYKTRRYTLCGLFGAVAVASRPNSFLIMAAFAVLALARLREVPPSQWLRQLMHMAGLLLMPLAYVAIAVLYAIRFNDPFATFHSSTFIYPQAAFYPFLYFYHIGEEGSSYTFFLVLAGILELIRRQHWDLALLCLSIYVPTLFVNVDTSRYLLPVMPFALVLAGDRFWAYRPVRIALLLCIPLVFTYAWSTMLDPGYQAPFGPLRALLP